MPENKCQNCELNKDKICKSKECEGCLTWQMFEFKADIKEALRMSINFGRDDAFLQGQVEGLIRELNSALKKHLKNMEELKDGNTSGTN